MPTISFDNPIKTPRYVLGPEHTWDSPGTYSVLFDILREEYGEDHISYPQPCKHPRFYYPRHVKYEIGGNDELKNNRVFRSNPVHRATWAALNSANGKLERDGHVMMCLNCALIYGEEHIAPEIRRLEPDNLDAFSDVARSVRSYYKHQGKTSAYRRTWNDLNRIAREKANAVRSEESNRLAYIAFLYRQAGHTIIETAIHVGRSEGHTRKNLIPKGKAIYESMQT